MNKTQEELKQKTLEAIAEDIGEMLEHYDEVLEPEDPLNTRIDRIEALWGQVKARTDLHIAKLMNELAGGLVEKQLIKKKEQIEAAEAGEVRIRNGGKQERCIKTVHGELCINRSVLRVEYLQETGVVEEGSGGQEKGQKEESETAAIAGDEHPDACVVPAFAGKSKTAIPVDEYLGIAGLPFKMTKQMMGETAYWGQNQSSFEMAHEVMTGRLGHHISDELIREVTEHVGRQVYEEDKERAEETDKKMPYILYQPEKEGVVYLMIDGSAINTREKNEAGSSWRENKLGVVFNSHDMRLRKGKDPVSGEPHYDITKKEYVSVVGGVEEFSKQLFECAVRNGYGQFKQTVIVSDGATWIRNMCETIFPDAIQILDLFHLAENIYTFAKYLFKGDAVQYEPWAKEILGLAKESKTEELLERLVKYKGRSLPAGVPNLYGYVNNNREKIDYAEYRKQGYYVGSGPIESGNKVVVQRRCKQAGMRWDETKAQYMLSLRAKHASNLWCECVEPLLSAA